ncbi:flagellar basal-body rod protein flgF [Candidatus Photodesmus blepharus]|uniref:Flagellar basal-body rod protein FlgF n=1 Tax=Candidatus Photodesmus blepharonis TaxID=1179155 RepID=A0A084CMF6_9GAMM|nr:flagellar basal body rod protein FlgF [Candidatus Photodesmus blepharus]KEY90985.1 flagellar basal-body rod protein flgF [Candidatus Photodesmus blepharus]
MDHALFLAMSGAKQSMQAIQLRANNLANVNTTGFRSDLAQARSMQVYGVGFPSRVFSMVERPGQNFSQGNVITTGRDLDMIIQGDGWISVLDQTGNEGLTRNGSFSINKNGLLTNSFGHLVLGDTNTPITLPIPLSKVEIGSDGTVSVVPQGAPADAIEIVNRIKLTSSNQPLFKGSNGLFHLKGQDAVYETDTNIRLLTGAVEGSNVNSVTEMTNLIDLQRQFEVQIKMMSTIEDMDKASASLISSTN